MSKSTKQIKALEHEAFLWDIRPFNLLVFYGRVLEKYGTDYFKRRYDLITGKYYEDIRRVENNSPQNIRHMANQEKLEMLEKQQQAMENQEQIAKKEAKVETIKVPEELKEIWLGIAQKDYLDEYENRKKLIDSYLQTLEPQERLQAIKTMIRNDESKNYVAFLNTDINKMNAEERKLFDDISTYVINNYIQELKEKEELSKKLDESAKQHNEATLEKEKEELAKQQAAQFLNIANQNTADYEYLKTVQTTNEDKFKIINPNAIDGLTDEQLRELTDEQINKLLQEKAKAIGYNSNNQYLKQNQEQLLKQMTNEELQKIAQQRAQEINSQIRQDFVQENVHSQQVKTVMPKVQQQMVRVDNGVYNQYVSSPTAFNIVDLINNRNLVKNNNDELVRQMVINSINANNEYIRMNNGTPGSYLKSSNFNTPNNNPTGNNNSLFNQESNRNSNPFGNNISNSNQQTMRTSPLNANKTNNPFAGNPFSQNAKPTTTPLTKKIPVANKVSNPFANPNNSAMLKQQQTPVMVGIRR